MGIVVFDLDGTLADNSHRLHLLPDRKEAGNTAAWKAFNKACGGDVPIGDNVWLLRSLYEEHSIVILTGRSDDAVEETEEWLSDQEIFYDRLIMRPHDDHRRDVQFKEEALRYLGLEYILCCFEDLEHVAQHIRSLGVTCHLVAHYGDTDRVDLTSAGRD